MPALVQATPTIAADVTLAEGVTRAFLLHHGVCPCAITAPEVVVAAAPGAFRTVVDELAAAYARDARIVEVSRSELERLVERLTTRAERDVELATAPADLDTLTTDVRDLANQPPVIRFVNVLLRDAADARASDIHLEATPSGLAVRFRIDGALVPAPEPPSQLQQAAVSRIKLLAELDVAERRRPQDGRFRVRLERRELDLRVSAVPTLFGESVVVRLLDRSEHAARLDELGMSDETRQGVERLCRRSTGLLLATGPTGSGKTTTLYAALCERNAHSEKIITVEDPVEYRLNGVAQVPVHRQAGVTFAAALRAILRQDPDVVMVGETRDRETAEVAVQAATTGHLVLSTLHTGDAIGAVARLLDLGVAPYLLAATLTGVLAQRLVRRTCAACKGSGCAACRLTGCSGRVGVFELLVMTDELRDAVVRGAPRAELEEIARRSGHRGLAADAAEKVREGVTTELEVSRVLAD